MKSPLNITVSCFKNYRTSDNSKPMNLMDWLTSSKYEEIVKQIRDISDKAERDKLKSTLPAITPSGTFVYRNEDNLIKHSGLIQFDIDPKDNKHIGNYSDLKNQISNIENVAYCGLSVSGKGYWGLIPIKYPGKHKGHFEALKKSFEKIGPRIDPKPRNVASLRGYSFDPDGYFNHSAKVFESISVLQPARNVMQTHYNNDTQSKVEKLIEQIQLNRIDITGGYDNWLNIGFALSDEFGEFGRNYFHIISQYYPGYNESETDRQYSNCLRSNGNGVTIGTLFFLAKQHIGGNQSFGGYKKKFDNGKGTEYPNSWDGIKAPDSYSQEDIESVRATIQDSEPDELKMLIQKDPIIKDIVKLFDTEIVNNY